MSLSAFYQTCGTPKPEPRTKTKRRARRLQSTRVSIVRGYIFARERDICRICRCRPADSMHELVFRSQGGKVSRVNSVATCGSGTSGCHGFAQHHEIAWSGTPGVGAEGTLMFTPLTQQAADWMRVAVGQQIESAPMSIYERDLG